MTLANAQCIIPMLCVRVRVWIILYNWHTLHGGPNIGWNCGTLITLCSRHMMLLSLSLNAHKVGKMSLLLPFLWLGLLRGLGSPLSSPGPCIPPRMFWFSFLEWVHGIEDTNLLDVDLGYNLFHSPLWGLKYNLGFIWDLGTKESKIKWSENEFRRMRMKKERTL